MNNESGIIAPPNSPTSHRRQITPEFERKTKDVKEARVVQKEKVIQLKVARNLKLNGS